MLASGLAVSSVYDEYVTEQLSYQCFACKTCRMADGVSHRGYRGIKNDDARDNHHV